MSNQQFITPALYPDYHDQKDAFRRLTHTANQLLNGKSFNKGSFTAAASASSTVVNDPRVGVDSVILWMPLTNNAALLDGTIYISSRGKGTFTVAHENTVSTDQDFEYAVIG